MQNLTEWNCKISRNGVKYRQEGSGMDKKELQAESDRQEDRGTFKYFRRSLYRRAKMVRENMDVIVSQ